MEWNQLKSNHNERKMNEKWTKNGQKVNEKWTKNELETLYKYKVI